MRFATVSAFALLLILSQLFVRRVGQGKDAVGRGMAGCGGRRRSREGQRKAGEGVLGRVGRGMVCFGCPKGCPEWARISNQAPHSCVRGTPSSLSGRVLY